MHWFSPGYSCALLLTLTLSCTCSFCTSVFNLFHPMANFFIRQLLLSARESVFLLFVLWTNHADNSLLLLLCCRSYWWRQKLIFKFDQLEKRYCFNHMATAIRATRSVRTDHPSHKVDPSEESFFRVSHRRLLTYGSSDEHIECDGVVFGNQLRMKWFCINIVVWREREREKRRGSDVRLVWLICVSSTSKWERKLISLLSIGFLLFHVYEVDLLPLMYSVRVWVDDAACSNMCLAQKHRECAMIRFECGYETALVLLPWILIASVSSDWSFKEKENRRPERAAHIHQISSNSGSSGSVPKRYQSVFTEGTPIASFGVRQDDQQRSHSVSEAFRWIGKSLVLLLIQPSSHPQPQFPQRPLKPVKEFLSGQPVADQHV